MAIFVTSDTHYTHVKILDYCNRPFSSVEEMDEALIFNWNSVVTPSDHTYHLGDFAMGPDYSNRVAAIRAKLNGTITMVLGNHDRSVTLYRKLGFEEVCREWEGRLPDSNGPLIYMRHHPPERPEARWEPYDLILCGHVHTSWLNKGKIVNVGVDQWNFTPVKLERLIELVK